MRVLSTLPFALLAFQSIACAAEDDSLDPVVVTANRYEQPVSRIGNSVTLLSADDVRDSQKTALSDLLAATPGVTVTRNGGLGGTTFLRIRGAETDQTVVLFDGVKLNDPSSPGGGYDFANLMTNDFARVEVLRGPQSTLWGSQAIGGVVNGNRADRCQAHSAPRAASSAPAWRARGSKQAASISPGASAATT
jgi:vitamin B12 transporter